jgi:Fur family peroxide stress response transcriptional regulator
MNFDDIRKLLKSYDLKVTPQRIAVMEAFSYLDDHPSAHKILEVIRQNHPSISAGTVYKTIDTLVQKGALKKVKTDKGVMRYDAVGNRHHHLYSTSSDRIEDYTDDELDKMLKEYFNSRNIPNFKVDSITLQISGRFNDEQE